MGGIKMIVYYRRVVYGMSVKIVITKWWHSSRPDSARLYNMKEIRNRGTRLRQGKALAKALGQVKGAFHLMIVGTSGV